MDISQTALLLIDLQKEGGTTAVIGMERIVKKAEETVKACRKLGLPIVYTRHINRSDGVGLQNNEPVDHTGKPIYYRSDTDNIDIIDQIKPQEQDIVIDKYRYSAFYGSELDTMLRGLGIKNLIIGGVLTDVCVLTTIYDAYNRNYQVNLLKDVCGTTTEGAHMSAILMMANWVYDLVVYDSEELIKMLHGEEHRYWKSSGPDELQFTPGNLSKIFAKL